MFPVAKRLECVELAPAFGAATFDDSASELDALQTLRVTEMPLFPYVSAFEAAHTKRPGADNACTGAQLNPVPDGYFIKVSA